MPAPLPTACRIKLVEQISTARCTLDKTFGCYGGGHTMWTSRGCRGRFRCSETVLACGRGHGIPLSNCSCLKEGEDLFTWPTEIETVQMLGTFINESRSIVPASWLGAIISTNASGLRFQLAAASVSAVGFAVRHIQAAAPGDYKSKSDMLRELFGAPDRIMISMTAYEIALLIGHRRALAAISLSNYSWGAVFEDDAYLHEAVPPHYARRLLAAAVAAAEAAPQRQSPPLLYIGACKPQCEADVVLRRDQAALADGLPEGLLRVGRCHAFCTHAYAVSRSNAATFFDNVFGCGKDTTECAAECELFPCFMDWAMWRFLSRSGEAWIVGGGLQSRWVPSTKHHRGLFIQNRSAGLGNHVGRSGLAKGFRWRNDSATTFDEQSCEAGFGVNESKQTKLRKVVITIDWTGRLGNLMFEVAMLAGVLQELKRIVPSAEAVTFGLESSMHVPAKAMFDNFHVSRLVRIEQRQQERRAFHAVEGNCDACRLRVRERFSNACDQDILHRLTAWVASPPKGCKIGLIQLQGFFQCRHYFDGAASNLLRSTVFLSKQQVQREADSMVASIRRELPRSTHGLWKLVGVQVRLGDKVQGKWRDIYAETSWDYYRVAMRELATMLRRRGAIGVAFIVTAGGSLGSNANDMANVKTNLTSSLTGRAHRIFFSTATSPFVDLAVLRSCDALVIGPSSFGWWGAYLAGLPAGSIVAPRHVINPKLGPYHMLIKGFRLREYYPADWRVFENDGSMNRDLELMRRDQMMMPTESDGSMASTSKAALSSSSPCPKKKGTGTGGPQRRCFFRIVGACQGYDRPQYRSWFPAPPGTVSEADCAKRQRSWTTVCRTTRSNGLVVEMTFCL